MWYNVSRMRTRILKTLCVGIIALIAVVPLTLHAQESGGVENVFSYGTGLRALGMGSAFTYPVDKLGGPVANLVWPVRGGH